VPFQPVGGFWGSDLPERRGFKTVRDPYTGEEVYVMPRVQPEWGVLHVQEADEQGNARIYGSPYWDREVSRAVRNLIVTSETIVPTAEFERQPELTLVPHFLTRAVVHAPGGAWPGSCFRHYDVDREGVREYLAGAGDPEFLARHLAETDRGLRDLPVPVAR
jgi:glutaconate CoA-transferase subunit A